MTQSVLRVALLAASIGLTACAARPEFDLSEQDRQTLDSVQAYLNGLDRLQASFVQAGTDGPGGGEIWLERPGRLRMDYAAPRKTVVASGGRLTMADLSTGAVTTFPVSNTPLAILLRDPVTLSGPVQVTSLRRMGGVLQLTLVQRDAAHRGTLSLDFQEHPLALYALTLTDATGRVDDLRLSHVERPAQIAPATFEPPPVYAPK